MMLQIELIIIASLTYAIVKEAYSCDRSRIFWGIIAIVSYLVGGVLADSLRVMRHISPEPSITLSLYYMVGGTFCMLMVYAILRRLPEVNTNQLDNAPNILDSDEINPLS